MVNKAFLKRFGISACVPLALGCITGIGYPAQYGDFEQSLDATSPFIIEGKIDYADIRHRSLKIKGEKSLSAACDPYSRSQYCVEYMRKIPFDGCFSLKKYRSFNIIVDVTDCRGNTIVSKERRERQISSSTQHLIKITFWDCFSIGFVIGLIAAVYCYYVTLKPEHAQPN